MIRFYRRLDELDGTEGCPIAIWHLRSLMFRTCIFALLAEHDVVIAAILKKCEIKQGQYVFDIPTVANSIGVTTTDLSNQLLSLKLKGEITYVLKDQAYCYTIVEIPAYLCSLSAHLTKWLTDIESCKVFLQGNLQAKFTPRAVARIMHGIESPAYPSTVWSKTHFWGRYTQIDFLVVMEAAKAELINFVRKDAI